AVDEATAAAGALAALLRSSTRDAHGVFLFSTERAADRATVYSRMFAPGLGIVEDPATGVASGPLGCYLVRHAVVAPQHAGAMLSLQGVRMGRPRQLHLSIALTGSATPGLRLAGQSCL